MKEGKGEHASANQRRNAPYQLDGTHNGQTLLEESTITEIRLLQLEGRTRWQGDFMGATIAALWNEAAQACPTNYILGSFNLQYLPILKGRDRKILETIWIHGH